MVDVNFRRQFMQWSSDVRPFEKSDDLGMVITEFLWYDGKPYYPVSDLVEMRISTIWLGEGERGEADSADLDVLFKMPFNPFIEIALRVDQSASYGGFLLGESAEVTEEIVNSHRVLISNYKGEKRRYEYSSTTGRYEYVSSQPGFNQQAEDVRRLNKSNFRRK